MVSTEKVNILIVDDSPEKLMSLEAILDDLGQSLVSARSGREALRRLLVQEFAVVLLDVYMPEMDGFETARLIRARKRSEHTPIIFITGQGDEQLAAQGYALGAVDYILSPVLPGILRTKVSVFVELYRQREQLKQQAEERISLGYEQAARAAAEAASKRSAFLAEASNILNNSLDYEETQRDLVRLVVPSLADLTVLTLADDASHSRSFEMVWQTQNGEISRHSVSGAAVAPAIIEAAAERVISSGRMEMLSSLEFQVPHDSTLRRFHSGVVLPLRARGRNLGSLALASSESRGTLDLDLVVDLTSRASIALDNARLYRDIQENDRRKSEFLAMLGHELRNPLAPIRNSVEFLRQCKLDQPELRRVRDTIDRQVQLMVRLVDDLLDVSRINSGKIRLRREVADFAAIADQAVEIAKPLIESRSHVFTVIRPEEPIWVEGDVARLAQVIANLLNNAAKYTPPHGEISLTIEAEAESAVARVRDNGIGLSADLLPRVFDLFTQADRSTGRDQSGLGVGLTLVRRLIEMHGGQVEARSGGPGRGSEFVVALPRVVRKIAHSSETAPRRSNMATPRRVLLVDDNADGLASLASLLRLKGHEVHIASDGLEALEAAIAVRPEVVVLDIGMPGMDGYEVARRLRRTPDVGSVRLVALTGYGQDEDRHLSREAGFDDHLVKPVDPAILDELLAAGAAN
jgi:signal transduction histidine kinase/DNA-binding response OmpR family regulator